MKYLKQIILMFSVSGVSSLAFAHSGAHPMGFVEGMIHFISSPSHMWLLIAVVFAVTGLNVYWIWTRYNSIPSAEAPETV